MQIKSYIVNPGDNLSKIAAANGTTVEALVGANSSITDPNLIMVGQQINIPTPTVQTAEVEIVDLSPVQEVDANLQAQLAAQQAQAAQAQAAEQAAKLQAQAVEEALVKAKAEKEAALAAQQTQAAIQAQAALKAQQEAEAAAAQAAQAQAAQQAAMAGVGVGDSAAVAAALGITPAQLDVVKATIRHEAGNNPAEMANVASCIKNRMNSGAWGGTNPYSVTTAKGQFQSYGEGYYKQYTGGNYYQGDAITAAHIDSTINGILLGTIAPTHGYQSFRGPGSPNGEQLVAGGNKYR